MSGGFQVNRCKWHNSNILPSWEAKTYTNIARYFEEDTLPFSRLVGYGFVPWRVSSFWKFEGHLLKLPETNSSHPKTHGPCSGAMSMFVFGEEFFFFFVAQMRWWDVNSVVRFIRWFETMLFCLAVQGLASYLNLECLCHVHRFLHFNRKNEISHLNHLRLVWISRLSTRF